MFSPGFSGSHANVSRELYLKVFSATRPLREPRRPDSEAALQPAKTCFASRGAAPARTGRA